MIVLVYDNDGRREAADDDTQIAGRAGACTTACPDGARVPSHYRECFYYVLFAHSIGSVDKKLTRARVIDFGEGRK